MSLSRQIVHRLAGRIQAGELTLRESWPGGETHSFGPRGAGLKATVHVHDPAVYRRLARSRSAGLGASYAEGMWDVEQGKLVPLLRILARDIGRGDALRRRIAPLLAPFQRIASLPALNTRRGARDNIASHYDLGNEMFELFLDRETMMYSAARYEHPDQGLEEAQRSRLDHICSLLELGPDDHLLEIGAGWGGLAVHAASHHGCRVTTTTISREQRAYAEARVHAAGLEGRVEVLGADYRDLAGAYDKLVSIEMIEAVGWEWFDTYFRRCSELLVPDGLFLLQAIVTADAAYEAEKRTRSFANSLIFPGGCLPSVAAIQDSIARRTDLRTIHLEDISASYALTLAEWRARFQAAAGELERRGYDERFRRLWQLYFSISEAGFTEGRIRDVQMLFAKPRRRTPLRVAPSVMAEEGDPAPA